MTTSALHAGRLTAGRRPLRLGASDPTQRPGAVAAPLHPLAADVTSTTTPRHAGIGSERGLLVAMATMVLLGVAALLLMVG